MFKEVEIDVSAVGPEAKKLRELPNKFIQAVMARAVIEIKDNAPAATGQMADAIRHENLSKNSGQILVDTNYASFVHDGRKAGGVDGKALIDWAKSKGKTKRDAFAISQWIKKHGTKKRPWVNDFIESVRMREIMQEALKREFNNVVG